MEDRGCAPATEWQILGMPQQDTGAEEQQQEWHPALRLEDRMFLGVIYRLYGEPRKHWPAGKPQKGESWIGPAFSAFRATIRAVMPNQAEEHVQAAVQQYWHSFLSWHHTNLGTGFSDEMLADPRVAAIHAHANAMKLAGYFPHVETEGLAARVRQEARRKRGSANIDANLTNEEVLGQLFASDDPRGLTLTTSGRWIANIQLLYDKLRCQRSRRETLVEQPDALASEDDPGFEPSEALAQAELVRLLRDELDSFRQRGPAEEGAVDRLLSQDSRRSVAEAHGITPKQLRIAEEKLKTHISSRLHLEDQ